MSRVEAAFYILVSFILLQALVYALTYGLFDRVRKFFNE